MPTIAEVRAQYPQYSDMSDAQLADALHKKFYSDVPKEEFLAEAGFAEEPAPATRNAGDHVSALSRLAAQGATAGFGDEVAAGIATPFVMGIQALKGNLIGPGEAFKFGVNSARRGLNEYRDDHPVTSALAELGGAVAAGGAFAPSKIAGSRSALGALSRVAEGSGNAALALGAYGFGTAEGSPLERLDDAGSYALGGAALGGTVAAGGAALRGIGGLFNAAKPTVGDAASVIVPTIIEKTGREVPAEMAQNVTARNVARAEQKVLERLSQDDLSPDELFNNLQTAPQGKALSMFDLGGENVSRLGRAVANVPGKGADVARDYAQSSIETQAQRVKADIGRFISPDTDFTKATDDILAAGRSRAAPLYEAAYQQPVKWTNKLAALLQTKPMEAARARAEELYEIDVARGKVPALKKGELFLSPDSRMHVFDYMKRGLDDVLEGYRDKTSGKLVLDDYGRSIKGLKEDFLGILDEQNPLYKKARSASKGYFEDVEALDMGRDFKSFDSEILQRKVAGMSDSEKALFRVGVARTLRETIDSTSDRHNIVKKIFGNADIRDRLKSVMGDKEYAGLKKHLEVEQNKFAKSQRLTGNSTTTQQALDVADLEATPLDKAGQAVKEGPVKYAIGKAVDFVQDRYQVGNKNIAEEIASMLFETDPAKQAKIIERLKAHMPDAVAAGP